jgi:hypothetical protein
MSAENNEAKTEQQEESPAERVAQQLRRSQWAGEMLGTRIAGSVVLVAIPNKPQEHP